MKINQERLIREFISLVSIDSPSFGEKQMGEFIKKRLASLGLPAEEDDAGKRLPGNCGNLYGYWKGNLDAGPLLFSAHMDTVEPSKGKQAIIGEDGVIRSDGRTVLGADDCAGIAAILEALRVVKEQNIPHRPIEVLFTVAEEPYCKGAEQFDYSKIHAKEAYVFDLSGPVGSAAYQAPTILSCTAVLYGKTAHAGFAPQNGVHAIAAAADAVGKLRMGRIGDDTTLNVGRIEGGIAANIVPDRCTVKGEIRSYSHRKTVEQAEIVRKHFETAAKAIGASADFSTDIGCTAYQTPINHPVVKRFEKACEILRLPVSLQQTFGGSDNNHLAKHGIAGIVVATAMNRCHSCEEYTTIEELCRTAELAVSLMTSED